MFDELKQIGKYTDSIIIFQSDVYYSLFFSLLIKRLKQELKDTFQVIDLHGDSTTIMSQLNMSFLGETVSYWLGSFDVLDAKTKKKWFLFLRTYSGPHQVFFHTKDVKELTENQSSSVIPLIGIIDKKEYRKLAHWLYPTVRIADFSKKVFDRYAKISLEQACLLLQYQRVLGSRTDDFVDGWLDKIVLPDTSLFQLSQFFFAKKPKLFFKLWKTLSSEYPHQFWVVFWSEQLWRSYYYICFQQQNSGVDAKKIAYRLPFSFIQRDWRNHSLESLRGAHHHIAEIDFKLKNNSTDILLDGFYARFFNTQA